MAAVSVVALCTQSYIPAASALLVDYSAPVDRVPLFALFRVALNLGAALGPLIAAVIASSSYDTLFVIDSATCLLFVALLLSGLPAEDRSVRPRAERPRRVRARARGGRARRTSPAVMLLCIAIAGVTLVYAQHTSTLPLDLTADGMSTAFYGLLLAFNGLLVVVGELPLASLTRRCAPHRPMIAGVLLMSVGMALSGLLPGAFAVLAAVALWSLGEMVLTPVANSAVAAMSPPDRIARDQGRLAAAQTVGFSLGPIVGVLAFNSDPLLPWLGCLAIGAASALAIGTAHRLTSRNRSVTPAPEHLPSLRVASSAAPNVAQV